MADIYQKVYLYFSQFGPIPEDQWKAICEKLTHRTYDTGVFFQKSGYLPQYLGLVLSGMFRVYYAMSNGKEFTRSFSDELKPIGDYACYLAGAEATVNIVALEPSEVAVIRFENYFALFEHHPCWDRIGRKVVEGYYMQREKREADLVMLSAKERYQQFIKGNQAIIARATNSQIASYLAVTPETLSRLKKT